jgi:hypothetical protein
MRWNRLILVALLAAACFGGSFTCEGHVNHDDDNHTVTSSKSAK